LSVVAAVMDKMAELVISNQLVKWQDMVGDQHTADKPVAQTVTAAEAAMLEPVEEQAATLLIGQAVAEPEATPAAAAT
jgi:hypothetical protein